MVTGNVMGNMHSLVRSGALLRPGTISTNNAQNVNFADALVANSASNTHTVRSATLYTDPDFVYAPQEPGGGCMSISIDNMLLSVYKTEDFCEDNPVMLVRGINIDGTRFEVEVDINKINPRNASLVELAALEGYGAATGKGLPAGSSAVSQALTTQYLTGNRDYYNGRADAFTKFDFVPAFQEMMEMQRYHRNWEGYGRYMDILDLMFVA